MFEYFYLSNDKYLNYPNNVNIDLNVSAQTLG